MSFSLVDIDTVIKLLQVKDDMNLKTRKHIYPSTLKRKKKKKKLLLSSSQDIGNLAYNMVC